MTASQPKRQVNRTKENDDRPASGSKPPGGEKRTQKSQMEGPAAYAPHEDEPASRDEARDGGKMQRQDRAEDG